VKSHAKRKCGRKGNYAKLITVTFTTPSLEQASSFPHAFITANPGKPFITVASNSALFKQTCTNAVQSWMTGTKELDAAKSLAFLYEYSQECPKTKLKKDGELWRQNRGHRQRDRTHGLAEVSGQTHTHRAAGKTFH
jgi:hypothetical protein